MTDAPVFISSETAQRVLTWPALIEALRRVYATPIERDASPPRTVARGGRCTMRALAGVLPSAPFMGVKLFGKAENGQVTYLIALFHREHGGIAALLDGNHITALRTAATSALAVNLMTPRAPTQVALLGSGMEARFHLRAIAAVRRIERATVFSPTPANRQAFAHELGAELNIACDAVASPEAAVDGASLVVCAARARHEQPVIGGSLLRPGTLVVSIGSTLPEQREVDVLAIQKSDLIVADMVDEVADATGDFIAATAAGHDFRRRLASLNELVMGQLGSRLAAAQITMFKSSGSALQDLAAATLAYQEAARQGLAVPLSMAPTIKH